MKRKEGWINRDNVGTLKRAWTYHTGEVDRAHGTDRHQAAPFETTPLFVDGMLYLFNPIESSDRILYGTFDGRLLCLDAVKGKPCQAFGTAGAVDLRVGVAEEFPTAELSCRSMPKWCMSGSEELLRLRPDS